jgi:hypothetical protein
VLVYPDAQTAILAIGLHAAFAKGGNGELEREQNCQPP